MPGALTTAAKAARIERDTRNAQAEAEAAARIADIKDAEYREHVDAATDAAIGAFGKVHADGIVWERVSTVDTYPVGTHAELPARVRFIWTETAGLRLGALPESPAGAGYAAPPSRPSPLGVPAIESLADLGDALAEWELDQNIELNR